MIKLVDANRLPRRGSACGAPTTSRGLRATPTPPIDKPVRDPQTQNQPLRVNGAGQTAARTRWSAGTTLLGADISADGRKGVLMCLAANLAGDGACHRWLPLVPARSDAGVTRLAASLGRRLGAASSPARRARTWPSSLLATAAPAQNRLMLCTTTPGGQHSASCSAEAERHLPSKAWAGAGGVRRCRCGIACWLRSSSVLAAARPRSTVPNRRGSSAAAGSETRSPACSAGRRRGWRDALAQQRSQPFASDGRHVSLRQRAWRPTCPATLRQRRRQLPRVVRDRRAEQPRASAFATGRRWQFFLSQQGFNENAAAADAQRRGTWPMPA